MLSLFFFLFTSAWADIGTSLDVELVGQQVSKGFCSTLSTAKICRAIPRLGIGEGVVDYGPVLYLFLDPTKRSSDFQRMASRFSDEKREEFLSVMIATQPSMISAIMNSSYNSVFLFLVEGTSRLKPQSVFFIDRDTAANFSRNSYSAIEQELLNGDGEWIPPEDFVSNYQFKKIN